MKKIALAVIFALLSLAGLSFGQAIDANLVGTVVDDRPGQFQQHVLGDRGGPGGHQARLLHRGGPSQAIKGRSPRPPPGQPRDDAPKPRRGRCRPHRWE